MRSETASDEKVEQVLALLALHDRDIVHHDVKPANILIDASGHIALTDFGGAYFPSHRTRFSFLRTQRSNANVIFRSKDGSDDDSDLDDFGNDQTPIFTLRYVGLLSTGGRRFSDGLKYSDMQRLKFSGAVSHATVKDRPQTSGALALQYSSSQLAR